MLSNCRIALLKGNGAITNTTSKGPFVSMTLSIARPLQLCPKAAKQRFGDQSKRARLIINIQSSMQLRKSANQNTARPQWGSATSRLVLLRGSTLIITALF